ncbi:hypothetical protein [Nocardioides solisilvae]|uniref:hypothetical protein n=1 Tax=Nocardioides solisilvae TaxID=1542435 RepID=UPI000D74D5E4|nr:hypothetical protein [Nocardioides solisilvae]
MSARDDDAAWQAIVDNYGERPSLADWDGPAGAEAPPADDAAAPSPGPPDPFPGDDPAHLGPTPGAEADAEPWPEQDEERFVPPPPPPLPRTSPLRRAAWVATLGSPLLLLVLAVLGTVPPRLVSLGLCVAFVVGFVYLVASMDTSPRDPWDNGARL